MKKTVICNTTGIFGTHHGSGTTHLALALANCLVSRSHRKTALVEINSQDLCNLLGEKFEYHEGLYHFSLLGIEIFSPASTDLINELKSSFDEIIVDFGYSKNISHDSIVCNQILITTSFSPFRVMTLNKFFRDESLQKLFCSKNSISCITQARNNICMFIKLFIKCSYIHIYTWMSLFHCLNSFRSCNDTHKVYFLASFILIALAVKL